MPMHRPWNASTASKLARRFFRWRPWEAGKDISMCIEVPYDRQRARVRCFGLIIRDSLWGSDTRSPLQSSGNLASARILLVFPRYTQKVVSQSLYAVFGVTSCVSLA